MSETRLVVDGLGFAESTRWHDGRVWLCNWGAGEVLAVTTEGAREVMARVDSKAIPFSIDWLPDGRLLVVDGPQRRLLAQGADGTLEPVADFSGLSSGPFNELVVSAAGATYVNGGSGSIVCVQPDGAVREVAAGLQWPNGMALLADERTVVVADSHAEHLLAFDVNDDGTLSGRRVWAELERAPDGICADADGAVWVATVPGKRCVRVTAGGEVLSTVTADRGCFACMLGGEDGRTLFIAAAQWRGMEAAMTDGPGVTGQLLAAPDQPAPHAGRP
ncbi:MAG: SMP-30/gluconolactonase/LRE family protein [Solirubrobacterales bacterium]|nr:SMP-30/gluconolactonase/LRE family protein [Solirubrobacterales bacterium]